MFGVVLLLGSVAAAAPIDQAQLLYQEGQAAFEAHEYEAAAAKFESAFAAHPLPSILFDAAQAYRLADEQSARPELRHKALAQYERFLQSVTPGSTSRLIAEKFVARVQAEDLRAQSEKLSLRAGELDDKAQKLGAQVEQLSTTASALKAQLQTAKRPVWKRGWFWGALGGAVAGALGISLAIVFGRSHPPTVDAPSRPETPLGLQK